MKGAGRAAGGGPEWRRGCCPPLEGGADCALPRPLGAGPGAASTPVHSAPGGLTGPLSPASWQQSGCRDERRPQARRLDTTQVPLPRDHVQPPPAAPPGPSLCCHPPPAPPRRLQGYPGPDVPEGQVRHPHLSGGQLRTEGGATWPEALPMNQSLALAGPGPHRGSGHGAPPSWCHRHPGVHPVSSVRQVRSIPVGPEPHAHNHLRTCWWGGRRGSHSPPWACFGPVFALCH